MRRVANNTGVARIFQWGGGGGGGRSEGVGGGCGIFFVFYICV